MAQQKKSQNSNKPSKAQNTKKNTSIDPNGLASQLVPYILSVIAILIGLFIFFPSSMGVVGRAVHNFLFGMLSFASYALPLFVIIHAIRWRMDSENGSFTVKIILSSLSVVFVSVLMHIWAGGVHEWSVVLHYSNGRDGFGGGVIGGLIGELLCRCVGSVGTAFISIALLTVFIMFILGFTPRVLWVYLCEKLALKREESRGRREALREMRKNEIAERRASERAQREAVREQARERARIEYEEKRRLAEEAKAAERERRKQELMNLPVPGTEDSAAETGKHRKFDPDIATEDGADENASAGNYQNDDEKAIDELILDEVMRRTRERVDGAQASDESEAITEAETPSETVQETEPEALEPVAEAEDSEEEIDLKKIFVDPEEDDLINRLADAYLNDDGSKASRPDDLIDPDMLEPDEDDGSAASAEEDLHLAIERSEIGTQSGTVGDVVPQPEVPVEKPYVFPPITMLALDGSAKDPNVREELKEKADRLVETLNSFHVKTKIVDICRGPTITRYELLPEAGIRVKSIANLVDDIALNLATTGVRIEAPIPGKSAVGIEVPNKNPAIVHLRTLLEDPRFRENKSKVYVALGQDVAGSSIYLDIAKMPHLLIAGATGMGKSVCINSIIMSILYKATPDEVKLILIDPKKVELSIYNGIPHLHTPVVTDPKKAAGTLAWAVNEMERRFSLIEEVGVRDLKNFNEITRNDPQYETLPQMVIIIDELADLMMTASDDVEQSICRLAQKARAAGMHLIIGTQRPSVNVITGVIKSNVPSRIAFTVASQMDSRVVIDRNGAESLIGRGDMLYNPVGAMKPIRVQGAFVSEQDVEAVVDYIKLHCGRVQYSQDVIEQIEREAARCASGKKGASGDDIADGLISSEEDPMFRPALELAVENGTISTSLIQRRLALGYGRAAKLIDRMQQLGYVSAPEGQKPRKVLLSRQQLDEMSMRD